MPGDGDDSAWIERLQYRCHWRSLSRIILLLIRETKMLEVIFCISVGVAIGLEVRNIFSSVLIKIQSLLTPKVVS